MGTNTTIISLHLYFTCSIDYMSIQYIHGIQLLTSIASIPTKVMGFGHIAVVH